MYVDTHVRAGTCVCGGQLIGLEHALIWVSSQSSETQGSDSICFPSMEITSVSDHAWLFTQALQVTLKSPCLQG